mmetsp:Transcript_98251/g.286471  ORF Transcript_98251/g.286471 Transcript_98251/m.286471 type:complete len:316 (-) Transcript_98251:460-1407(-)
MARMRKLWPSGSSHLLHLDHPERMHGSDGSQFASQRFVSSSGPWAGKPHSLFMTAMLLSRSHRPTHVGLVHSPQALNSPCLGTHSSLQGCESGHVSTESCVPEQRRLPDPAKREPSACRVRPKARFRMVVLAPQPASQPLGSDHLVHAQKSVSSQLPVQLDTSFALPRLQGAPQWLFIVSMDRCRQRWPPHLLHSPHSPHSPHIQSTHGSIGPHCCVLHGAMRVRLSVAVAPPFFGSVRSRLVFVCWPPPQERLHSPHSLHWLNTASCFGTTHSMGACPLGPGLHGSMCLSESDWQGLPFAWAKTAIKRLRSRTP